jgi:hypothetical protein
MNAVERRRSRRSSVLLAAIVQQRGESARGKLSNLSSGGALVLGPALAPNTRVVLRRQGLSVAGHVIWREGDRSAVAFEHPLDPGSMLRTIAQPKPRNTHRHRRSGLKCVPLSNGDREMLERWATAGTSALGQ